jgi:hypothetical protein
MSSPLANLLSSSSDFTNFDLLFTGPAHGDNPDAIAAAGYDCDQCFPEIFPITRNLRSPDVAAGTSTISGSLQRCCASTNSTPCFFFVDVALCRIKLEFQGIKVRPEIRFQRTGNRPGSWPHVHSGREMAFSYSWRLLLSLIGYLRVPYNTALIRVNPSKLSREIN